MKQSNMGNIRSWEKEKTAASSAALAAGEIIKRAMTTSNIGFSHKSETEIVTKYDLEVEKTIIRLLSHEFPTYGFITEEENAIDPDAEIRWIIDPIDGTTNFSKGYTLFATSIGLECAGELVLGVVYNPACNEMFLAEKGKGATLNGKSISVSGLDNIRTSLLATGFPYDTFQGRDNNMQAWQKFFSNSLSVRCDGCASLDLCNVACGRIDGYWEGALSAWDIAGGIVVASEAGAVITDLEGSACDHHKGNVVAANPKMSKAMLEVLGSIRH